MYFPCNTPLVSCCWANARALADVPRFLVNQHLAGYGSVRWASRQNKEINGKWRAVDADYEYANIVGIGSARNSIERTAILKNKLLLFCGFYMKNQKRSSRMTKA